jgi:hypothetical protein
MRPQIVKKIVLTLCIHLLMYGYALGKENHPPAPRPGDIPPGPGLFIDSYIFILMVIGIIFGLWFLRRKKNT